MTFQGLMSIFYHANVDGVQKVDKDLVLMADRPVKLARLTTGTNVDEIKPLKLKVKCRKRPKVLDQIRVANSSATAPKLLCFIMSHSEYQHTRLKAIRRTWGRRCNKLLVASNQTDLKLGAVVMTTESNYLGLWEKLNETLQYIWDHYRSGGYDWVLKADDDTYVIVENLKEYLGSPEIKSKMEKPMILGRRYSSPRYKDLTNRSVYFENPVNAEFGKRFYQKMDKDGAVIYNYGGAGYAMNWPYVQKFLEVMKGPDTIHGTPPEDQAHGVVMAYHDIWPENTRDYWGRERFHQEGPGFMYSMSEKFRKLFNGVHQATGGLAIGKECCSNASISFHHVGSRSMVNLEQYLYSCPGQQ